MTVGGAQTRWEARPGHAAALRAAAFVVPIAVSVVAGLLVSSQLPPAVNLPHAVLGWAAVLSVSTSVMIGVDRMTRRMLPVATLLKLSMVFPDRAPSRYAIARRASGSRTLAAELEAAREAGVAGDRQQAAETVLALVGSLGSYDSRTRGHSERTQLFVTMLADELGLKQHDKDRLLWAALVHDIGKLRVPSEVLNKPGSPDDREWDLLRQHPVDGATICEPLREWLGPWWLAIEQHHERWDGTGYPRGLAGEDISLSGRVVAVADSYEVMTAARPYKKPMTATAAREELTRCAGTHFDPDVVRAFLSISLGRMRWAAGPLSWLAQIPGLPHVPLLQGAAQGALSGAAAVASTTAALVGLGLSPVVGGSDDPADAPVTAASVSDVRPAVEPVAADTEPAAPDVAAEPVVVSDPPAELPPLVGPPLPEAPAEPAAAVTPFVRQPAPPRGPVVATSAAPSPPATPMPTTTPTPSATPIPTPTPSPTPVNAAPVAANDHFVVERGEVLRGNVLLNDTDVDGDPLTVLSDDADVIDVAADGSFSFVAEETGVVRFTYLVGDGQASTPGSVSITVNARKPSTQSLFLLGSGTGEVGRLSTTPPLSSLTDWDLDGNPGLTIEHGGTKPDETDPAKYHVWEHTVPAGGLVLEGPVQLELGSTPAFTADKDVDYAAWLYACDAAGLECALIAAAVDVHVDRWTTTTGWEQRTVDVGTVSRTVPAGHVLRFRLGFDHRDVWLGLDAAHPSRLLFTIG